MFSIVLFVTFSCNKPSAEKNPENDSVTYHYSDTLPQIRTNIKITEYKEFINQLDKSESNSSKLAIDQFKKTFANQTKTLCDSGFVIFQQLMDSIELNLNNKLQKDTTDYSIITSGSSIPPKIQTFQTNLKQNGFKLSSSEGIAYIEQNRKFIIPIFDSLLTVSMQAYLKQIALENEQGFASDGAISITPKQHVDRIIWHENFIAANPKFVFINNCQDYKKAYFSYLLSGFENTALYTDMNTQTLSTYYTKAYNYMLSTYPNSESSNLLKPYYAAIKAKNKNSISDIYKGYVIKGLIYNMK